jgi:hypothetical protein
MVTNRKSFSSNLTTLMQRGENKLMLIKGEIVMENVRRYRAIASLYRQTAAFRPLQGWSLLEQAERWEHLAVAELEAYFNVCNSPDGDKEPRVIPYADAPWKTIAEHRGSPR